MSKQQSNETCLAMDLGGTKLMIGEVDHQGNILQSKRYPTGDITQKQGVQIIFDALDDYMRNVGFVDGTPACMGMGMMGRINHKEGIWDMIDPGRFDKTPIVELIEQKFGFTFKIDNDVKAATLAEKEFGAGKDTDNFIYVNIGTGIGAGFMMNGDLVRGYLNDSGEIGHTVVDLHSDIKCGCGRYGCVEAIASGGGMNRRCKQLSSRYPESPLASISQSKTVTFMDIVKYTKQYDPLATKILTDAADALGELLTNLIYMMNPMKIILGGGVMSDEFMFEQVIKRIRPDKLLRTAEGIVLSPLDPSTTGLIGAAVLGFAGKTQR